MLNMPSFKNHVSQTREFRRALVEYLENRNIYKLQLGSGANIKVDWLNTDIAAHISGVHYLDVTKPFRVPDSTFDYLFSEHQVEHISFLEGNFMLRECFRVLKPGGVLRVSTPDLEALLGLYNKNLNEAQQAYIRFITDRFILGAADYNPTLVINNAFRNWGHQFIYDAFTLAKAMERAGFKNVITASSGSSRHVELRGLEMHGQFIHDEVMSSFETMVLEGERPLHR